MYWLMKLKMSCYFYSIQFITIWKNSNIWFTVIDSSYAVLYSVYSSVYVLFWEVLLCCNFARKFLFFFGNAFLSSAILLARYIGRFFLVVLGEGPLAHDVTAFTGQCHENCARTISYCPWRHFFHGTVSCKSCLGLCISVYFRPREMAIQTKKRHNF